jgi:hypothetical protein
LLPLALSIVPQQHRGIVAEALGYNVHRHVFISSSDIALNRGIGIIEPMQVFVESHALTNARHTASIAANSISFDRRGLRDGSAVLLRVRVLDSDPLQPFKLSQRNWAKLSFNSEPISLSRDLRPGTGVRLQ